MSGASGDRRVLHLGGVRRAVLDGRLAEADADLVKVTKITVRQIGITLADVFDRLVHPVTLVIDLGVKNAATVDVTEQFVAGSIEKLLSRHCAGQTTLHS